MFSKRKVTFWLFDAAAVFLLIYVLSWFGLWYMQKVWLHPGKFIPATEFTNGHLVATTVGIIELENGGFFQFHSADIGWPQGLSFKPLMWPTILLGYLFGPVAGLNLIWTYLPAFNAICGYVLARFLGLRVIPCLLCGVLLAWNPWVRATLGNGQIEQSGIGLIALCWAFCLWSERQRLLASFALFLLVLVGGLTSPNCILAGLLGLPVLAIGRVTGNWRRGLSWVISLTIALVAAFLVGHYHAPNFEQPVGQFFRPRIASDASMVSQATLSTLFFPMGEVNSQLKVIHSTFLGWTWIGTSFLAALFLWKRTYVMILLAVWGVVLAMGPSMNIFAQEYFLPISWLQYYVPIVAQSGSYYRFVMMIVVALSCLAAVLIGSLTRTHTVIGFVAACFVGYLAFYETMQLHGRPLPIAERSAFWYPELSQLKKGAGPVLGLPLLKGTPCDANSFRYLNGYWIHRRPILHSMEPPVSYLSNEPTIGRLQRTLKDQQCSDKVADIVAKLGVTTLIVRQDVPCALLPEEVQCLESAFGEPDGIGQQIQWWNLQQ